MYKVSIVIPVYNVEPYLMECLDSVVNQTLKDIEIICVNDGSTDNSLEILKEYASKDKRIKIIDKPNSGYGHSMNTGIDSATGEYLGIVEPDDYIELNMYETLYNKAKELDLDFIKADFCRFTGEGINRKFIYNKLDPTEEYYNRLINIQKDTKPFVFIMNTWSGIYKIEYLRKHNIRHNETPGASFQDNGFWFQTFMYSTRAYFINTPFYMNRRDNPNSSVKNKNKVYCMCAEYDFIRNIIDKNQQKENFIPVYQYRRYNNYFFTLNRIDNKFKKKFIQKFSNDFKLAMQNGEIDKNLFNSNQYQNLELLINNPSKFYKKYMNKKSGIKNIFSIKNRDIHKVITICGVKLKLKNKKLIKEIQLHDFIDSKFKALESHLEEIKLQNEELRRGLIFNNLLSHKDWIKDKDIIPAKGFANYSLLYILLVILDKIQPENILEFGFGQTTKLTTQYEKFFKKTDSSNTSNGQNIVNKKYDLIIIGSSSGSDKIQTININDLIPQNLAGDFIIILDDMQSELEQNTAQLIFEKLDENNIKYSKFCCGNAKSQLVITSDKYKFLTLC